MGVVVVVLILAILLFGFGFAVPLLWWAAVIVLVVWLLGWALGHGSWYGRRR